MNPKKNTERGILGTIFLEDRWRKLLALTFAIVAWFLISNEIKLTKTRVFTITPHQADPNSSDLFCEIPTRPGFTLWMVNQLPLDKDLTIEVTFEGPRQEVDNIPEALTLSIDRDRLEEISLGKPELEITLEDLRTPQTPSVRRLINRMEFTGAPSQSPRDRLILTYEPIIAGHKVILDQPDKLLQEVNLRNEESLPGNYRIDRERRITYDPLEVRVSGPKVLIDNIDKFPNPNHQRTRLLEDFVITGNSTPRLDANEQPYLVQTLGLAAEWSRLSMYPTTVKVSIPLIQNPGVITYADGDGLPVDIIGPGADGWVISYGPSRPVKVEIYDQEYWWRVVNNASLGERSKENPEEQKAWVRNYVRLVVTTADLDPALGSQEQSLDIHSILLPPKTGEEPSRYTITIIQGGTRIKIKPRQAGKSD